MSKVILKMEVVCKTPEAAQKLVNVVNDYSTVLFDKDEWPEITELGLVMASRRDLTTSIQIMFDIRNKEDITELKKVEHHIDWMFDSEWFADYGVDYDHIENVHVDLFGERLKTPDEVELEDLEYLGTQQMWYDEDIQKTLTFLNTHPEARTDFYGILTRSYATRRDYCNDEKAIKAVIETGQVRLFKIYDSAVKENYIDFFDNYFLKGRTNTCEDGRLRSDEELTEWLDNLELLKEASPEDLTKAEKSALIHYGRYY